MADSNKWVADIQTTIYSRVEAILTARLGKTYPDLFITDNDEVPSEPKFPAIYINFLAPSERGNDLNGNGINAIYQTVEVQVTVTNAQGMIVARDVAYEVTDVFKGLRFNATLPTFDNSNNTTKRMIARYSRTIGASETI